MRLACLILLASHAYAAPVQWKRLPHDTFMCTRFGPDWTRESGDYPAVIKGRGYSGTFVLTLPVGHVLKTKLLAKVPGKGKGKVPVRYATSGWPAGVVLDAESGELSGTITGTPGQVFDITFEATAPEAEPAAEGLQLVIASEAQALAWRAGAGGKTWPDCEARRPEQRVLTQDFDGDGVADVLVSSYYIEDPDLHAHRFSEHQLVSGKTGALVPWAEAAGPLLGDVETEKMVDDTPLLWITHHACNGPNRQQLFRVKRSEVELVTDFDWGPDDESYAFQPHRDAQGRLEAVTVLAEGTWTKHVWQKGRFKPTR